MGNTLTPLVSVIMPVYNGEKFLKEAIESILNQTYSNFEFIIINDASTDGSVAIINSYSDARIQLIHNPSNMNLPYSLNRGISIAKGKYIVRMDADDISFSNRIEEQVKFMEENPTIGISGTWSKLIGSNRRFTIWKNPIDYPSIKCALLFTNPILHPSVIIRKSTLIEHFLQFDTNAVYIEDYKFWIDAAKVCIIENLPKVLLQYRIHDGQITSTKATIQQNNCTKIRQELLSSALGINNVDMELHQSIYDYHKKNKNTNFSIVQKFKWLDSIEKKNKVQQYVDTKIMRKFIKELKFKIITGTLLSKYLKLN